MSKNTVVNEVISIDETGLKLESYNENEVNQTPTNNKSQFCAGIFIAFAMIIGGIWIFRRNKKM